MIYKNLCLLLFVFVISACTTPENKTNTYTIDGTIKNAPDGMKVTLSLTAPEFFNEGIKIKDTAIIKNETFQFKGTCPAPFLYAINFLEPEKKRLDKIQIPLFLENGHITIEADINDMPNREALFNHTYDFNKVIIKGSKSQARYQTYLAEISPFELDIDKCWEENTKNWKEKRTLSISEGIELAEKFEKAWEGKKAYVFTFLKKNMNNAVGQYLAYYLPNTGSVKFSREEYDELLALVPANNEHSSALNLLENTLKKMQKIAVGSPYQDLTFNDPNGNPVKLSEVVEKGKYTLVEFWASWCGPCRADIPHLKEIYKLYHQEGYNMVSISLDDSKEKWLEAVRQEGMLWDQYNDPMAFKGAIGKVYNIRGIPACFLIGPDGTIVTDNMRGSYMDKRLIEMYGNKFGDKY
ncbi:AhpC/TSA family protein [Flavobacteriaceae bacterium F08102]|nr:AhpC/TSA family protein [Flavobacteriaceae bacterium F08102]